MRAYAKRGYQLASFPNCDPSNSDSIRNQLFRTLALIADFRRHDKKHGAITRQLLNCCKILRDKQGSR